MSNTNEVMVALSTDLQSFSHVAKPTWLIKMNGLHEHTVDYRVTLLIQQNWCLRGKSWKFDGQLWLAQIY